MKLDLLHRYPRNEAGENRLDCEQIKSRDSSASLGVKAAFTLSGKVQRSLQIKWNHKYYTHTSVNVCLIVAVAAEVDYLD